jgi:phosphoribosylformylglycinamidine synthase
VCHFYYSQMFCYYLGVAPFPGATTGTGGRIRDVQAAGSGSNVVAGTAGYCFGNLNIPGNIQ